eukprot:s1483_g23.t1
MLTQWYENGDGVMICCTNGYRPDHPQAELVVAKLLLAESGHYILPVNKEDQTMTEAERSEVLRLWRGKPPSCHNVGSKLQFTAETAPSELFATEPKNVPQNVQVQDKLNLTMNVSEDEPPIQVLKTDNMEEEYIDKEQAYPGDRFPDHLPEGKLKYLSKLYRAIPEEYYSKTRRPPITPRNAKSWARQHRGGRFHLWEFCSGSGRLSLLALCAGLLVMFPLGYRYGWDLGCASHRKLIDEIEAMFQPDVEYMSPACRPWSIASTRRDLEQTQRERNDEMPVIEYLKKKAKHQCKNHRGYIFEQPWSSAMWDHLEDNPGQVQRTDQCRFGAKDEVGNPILKPTGLQSCLALKHCLQRCKGHLAKKHGWLQGIVQGNNRTALASVYPEALCRAIIKDIKRFVSNKSTVFSDYYKCERCAMGRAATDDLRHSFIPGECRHGKWPEGEAPKDKKKAAQEQREQDDLWETFRNEALKNEKVNAGRISAHPDFAFNNEQLSSFKMVMVKLLDESIRGFEEAEKEKRELDYFHWLKDPTAMGWIKKAFQEYMKVQGVMSCLTPWSKPTPSPHLTLEQAPLRLLIQGPMTKWTISKIEDLREMRDLAPLEPPQHDGEGQDQVATQPGSLKPLYDFRRVFKKLPKLAEPDEVSAKRLILGLHERMWHASYSDVQNILIRCGMPHAVWRPAADAIATCAICRRYSRAGRRPQYRGAHLSGNFNDLVQRDVFHFQDELFMLVIDEATRYKVAAKCPGRYLRDLLNTLMTSWIRYFGPMRVIVTDQESSFMTVAAGDEFQRLSIERRPAGTTSGRQGQRHTTTGLVEKHVDLIKLTMLKIQAEAGRWGFEVGGFLDPEEAQYGSIEEGAPESTFERSLRLRQIALQAAQASILESRIARASRSRPHRLQVEDLIPGTTAVEIYREDGSGQGWRGPAAILKIEEEAGNAMVDFQGKPYLLGLRHIRPLRESFHALFNATTSTTTLKEVEKSMTEMKEFVEGFTMGEVLSEKDGITQMTKFPKTESPATNNMLNNAKVFLHFHYQNFVFHGIKFGKGMKTIMVPKYSRGVLITWPEGSFGIAITEHNNDAHIHIKEYISINVDKLCHLYFYGYVSTTATRLSQRIVVSVAATHDFVLASLDVSGAFLKGFTFEKVRKILAQRGIVSPPRKVVIVPPPNTWRQLGSFDSTFHVPEESFAKFGLLCLKPSYGLDDAPLAWQLSLQDTLQTSGGVQSLLDECVWHFKTAEGQLKGLISTHVDDLAVASGEEFLRQQQKILNDKYGRITVQRAPFTHCGCRCSELPSGGFKIDQQDFINALQCQEISDTSDTSRALKPEEVTKFRSALGGLLWLTSTRLDLVADVSALQSKVTKATVADLLTANAVIRKAKQKQYEGLGLVYRRFSPSTPWRILSIHDAPAAAKTRNYAQEGILILLSQDQRRLDPKVHTVCGTDVNEEIFVGTAHISYAHGSKAKRICYSTSHAETLAAISGLEASTLVSVRLAEILMKDRKPTLQQLAALQERGVDFLPVDSYTDCKDFFALSTGTTALPQDKSQRVYILAHREARIQGRLRWMILVPTASMTADALTKIMISKPLLELMSGGYVQFFNKDGHPIQARRLPSIEEFTEDELEQGDSTWLEKKNYMSIEEIRKIQNYITSSSSSTTSSSWTTRSNMWLIAFLCLANAARGNEMEEAQCSAEEGVSQGQIRVQAIVISVMTLVVFCMAYILFCLKKTLDTLKSELQNQVAEVIHPMLYRVMDLECNDNVSREGLDVLRREAAEVRGDLNTLFRAVRHASPHPEEPSHQRRRLHDNRPPEAEPDQEHREDSPQPASEDSESENEQTEDDVDRLVNMAIRSRSRDDSRNRASEEPAADDEAEAFPHQQDPEQDEHRAEHERIMREHSLMIHYMTIQANNLGVYLHTDGQIFPQGRIPFGRIEHLYVEHAPFLPLPSTEDGQEDINIVFFNGNTTYTWKMLDGDPIEFQSLEGLHGYRCAYMIAHRDHRLSPEDRRERLYPTCSSTTDGSDRLYKIPSQQQHAEQTRHFEALASHPRSLASALLSTTTSEALGVEPREAAGEAKPEARLEIPEPADPKAQLAAELANMGFAQLAIQEALVHCSTADDAVDWLLARDQ